MQTVAFCEIDPYCRAVLKKHWPDVPCHDDVRTLPAIGCDLVCGGFPCQPWSTAGRRKGADDDRHLWPAMLEVIRRERPTWVCGENVAGLIGMGLDQVLADLESLSYSCRAFVIPAAAVGAIHRRDRVWILAYSASHRRERLQRQVGITRVEGPGGAADAKDSSCLYPDSISRRRQGSGWAAEPSNQEAHGDRKADQSFHALEWPTEPPVRGANDGVSRRLDRHRLRALGNAVVPQVVEMIGRAIMQAEQP